MTEKDFAEEFFLHVVKTKQAKKARQEEKKIKKVRRKIKTRVKKKEKETEKIAEKELIPETKITAQRAMPLIAPLPAELEHVPEPPAHVLMAPPKIPQPRLLQVPRFFEQEIKIKPIINLGKLNTFTTDPTIESIQCDGSFMPIKVFKKGEPINTNVELNDREITDIINKFAEQSGQEVKGPVFKASIQGLMLSAVVSEFVGIKFMITKK